LADRPTLSLDEALKNYISILKEGERREAQIEISRFIRWCGRDRPLSDLKPPEIGTYAEEFGGASTVDTKRLEPVRKFLRYLHKSGLTQANLTPHLKVASNSKHSRKASVSNGPAPEKVYMTSQDYDHIQEEIKALDRELANVIKDIALARADGDVRENAPLEAARERQGFLMSQKRTMEAHLANAVIEEENVRSKPATNKVGRNSKVTLRDVKSGREISYTLVDPRETNPAAGKISFASPIGQALMDRVPGQEVSVSVPSGTIRLRVEKVEN